MLIPVVVALCVFFTEYIEATQNHQLVVSLPKGDIQGHILKSYNGSLFYAFQEIPFASPPVGDLRFQPPVEPKPWNGILETIHNTKICHQAVDGIRSPMENEDCLYLNVYTPVKPGTEAVKSVLVFFYGGAFANGDATYFSYGPQFHMDFDVIVVTVNYRLGIFGFLSTQDTTIPGNYGLKDQLLALKWVNENIHLFGGDPAKVTINGQSAGGAVVGYHIISKESKGLFRAAIMQSGSPICSWALQRNARTFAYKLTQRIDPTFSTSNSSDQLLALLKSVPAKQLNSVYLEDLYGIQLGQGNKWAPVIEVEHEGAFITDLMHEKLKNGDFNRVPLIIGINSEEQLREAENRSDFTNLISQYDDDLSLIVNEDFNFAGHDIKLIGQKLRGIYTDGRFQDDLGASIRFRSDHRYTTSLIRDAYLQSQYTDVYFYEFAYHGLLGLNNMSVIPGTERVEHKEQMRYLWNMENTNLRLFPEKDQLIHMQFLTLLINFVKHLNPTPNQDNLLQNIKWPLLKTDKMLYLNINETLQIKQDPKEYKAWAAIVDEYGHPPFDTY